MVQAWPAIDDEIQSSKARFADGIIRPFARELIETGAAS